MDYYEHRPPCDATQIGRFRRDLGEEGLEQLLKATSQRTVLGIVMREVQRKSKAPDFAPDTAKAASDLGVWLERAERVRTQQRHDKNKLYALHAPEVECIGKGKARKPYECGVKSALVVFHKPGLMLGARTFPGNPYDGHILSAVLEQASNLLLDQAVTPEPIVVDPGFGGVGTDHPGEEIIHAAGTSP